MFRVTCFADDRKLAEILHFLAGRAYDVNAVPVTNLDHANGQLKAVRPNGKGDLSELVLPSKGSRIRPKWVKENLPSIGWKPTSVSYALNALLEAKKLKKLGSGLYEVLS